MPQTTKAGSDDSVAAVKSLGEAYRKIQAEIRKVIIGQDKVVEDVLVSLFCRGHALLIGVPGLAKTLLISTLARILDLKFKRIQFTPDLMPADITGSDIIEEDPETRARRYKFIQGPVFANIILADEINRTPPKTQAALLQAMQEKEVTVGISTYKLTEPFLVLATQNPIEQEGTYPLPEAQQDRFMFNVWIDYPTFDEEIEIGEKTTVDDQPQLSVVMGAKEIMEYQHLVRRVPIARHVVKYAAAIARATRPKDASASDVTKKWVAWGAGPRATQNLVIGAKARAALNGRFYASPKDVRETAIIVLRHRIIPNFSAEAEGIDSMFIIDQLLKEVPEPKE
ncbi:MAG TPA: MoxR family ATPase [Planctomycetota bacterium]|nr:MoxR family ATPase [Planctomycetota bacterium]